MGNIKQYNYILIRNYRITLYLFTSFIYLQCLSIFSAENPVSNPSTIIEGKGIINVACIGDSLEDIKDKLNEPDKIVKDDWYNSNLEYIFYYHKGIQLIVKDNRVISLVIYSRDPKFNTFQGCTKKGLLFNNDITLKDIYSIYGTPKSILNWDENNFETKLNELRTIGNSYAIDQGDRFGIKIVYPKQKIEFSINDKSITCTIGKLERKGGRSQQSTK